MLLFLGLYFVWSVVGCDIDGSLCGPLWWCGGCRVTRGGGLLLGGVSVLWLVLYE